MAVVIEGPSIGGTIDYNDSWEIWLMKALDILVATEETSAIGVSVQESGNFGQSAAMVDQFVGKVGPKIGKWDPEAGSRMVQEF